MKQQSFDDWFAELSRLATEHELAWLVTSPDEHREAWLKGIAAEDEISTLADMAQWGGCGCGGG